MRLSIGYNESKLVNLVKAAGGKWNRDERVWELAYKDVAALSLTGRIVKNK